MCSYSTKMTFVNDKKGDCQLTANVEVDYDYASWLCGCGYVNEESCSIKTKLK